MMTAETIVAITDEEEEQLLFPEGWQVVRLESLCSIKGGKRLPAGADFSPTKTAFPYIRVTDFTNGTVRTSQLKYLDEETQKQIARYIINRDDIYISIAGSIGIVGTIPAELDGANLTENAARLILDQEQVDRDFLARYLQSAEGQQQIKLRTNLVGQPKLALERIATIEIPLPPTIEEQKRIAAVLDEQMNAVAQARAAVEAQLEAAQRLPNALLRAIFESEEAEDWEQAKLGEVCDVQLGKMLSPKSKTGNRSRPYLRNANVQWAKLDLSDIAKMDFSESEEQKFELKYGDLLVCEGGEPGRAAIWREEIQPCYYQKALHRLRPLNGAITPEFMMYRLWYGANEGEFFNSHAKTTIAHLPAVRLIELPINLPDVTEQQRIVQNLNQQLQEVESLKQSLTAQLAAINKMPAALLRKAFAGEL